jgi:glycosyltransferase involved in cell wall biosynthesis
MAKKLLILNPASDRNIDTLYDFFEALDSKLGSICVLSKDDKLVKRCRENGRTAQKIKYWPEINSLKMLAFYLALFPITIPFVFLNILFLKIKKGIGEIICFSNFDKIYLTPLAKILKIKIIWLILPNEEDDSGKIINFLIKFASKAASIVCISEYAKNALISNKYQSWRLNVIVPGIKDKNPRQENIFEKLAENDKKNRLKKFFTIGCVMDLDSKQNIETILKAAKKTLSVVPNLQLIVIGDGKEKKVLSWLVKKMEISNMVWFVGEQAHLEKWFDNFEIYIVGSKQGTLFDIGNVLHAMSHELPVIAPENGVWREIFSQSGTGVLLEKYESDDLAREIISLKRRDDIRKKIGKEARTLVDNKFKVDKMVEQFSDILNK